MDAPSLPPAQATLVSMAERPCGESKKFRMCVIGLRIISGITAVAFALLWVKSDIGGHVVSLAQVAVGSVAGIAGIYCGAQAHADGRTAAALGTLTTPQP